MNVILAALGSHGDVHPFIGIGLGLRARGHRVRVVANAYFTPLIEDVGVEAISLGTAEEYKRMAANPALWRRFRGTRTAFSFVGSFIRPVYDAIASNFIAGQTVVGASTLALGARVAQDHLGVPTASIHLQPSMFFSTIDPPYLPGLYMRNWMPAWMKRAQYAVVDGILDRIAGPALNEFRHELGLPPARRVLTRFVNSPDRVIGLFPEWFAPPQPDWPPQARLSGFPLYDERGTSGIPESVLKFLDEGDPPVAFTPGSAMWIAHRFLEESAAACKLMGRRGLLLTRHRDHLPSSLPPGVLHVEYAPFSELLPRCAALVHHGGIGTSAQALSAGIPQLIVPHAHDQPDNAARLVRLGVAQQLAPKQFRRSRIAALVNELIASPGIRENCRQISRRFGELDPVAQTCDLIEQLLPSPALPTVLVS